MRTFSKAHFCLDVPYIINTIVSITVLIEKNLSLEVSKVGTQECLRLIVLLHHVL